MTYKEGYESPYSTTRRDRSRAHRASSTPQTLVLSVSSSGFCKGHQICSLPVNKGSILCTSPPKNNIPPSSVELELETRFFLTAQILSAKAFKSQASISNITTFCAREAVCSLLDTLVPINSLFCTSLEEMPDQVATLADLYEPRVWDSREDNDNISQPLCQRSSKKRCSVVCSSLWPVQGDILESASISILIQLYLECERVTSQVPRFSTSASDGITCRLAGPLSHRDIPPKRLVQFGRSHYEAIIKVVIYKGTFEDYPDNKNFFIQDLHITNLGIYRLRVLTLDMNYGVGGGRTEGVAFSRSTTFEVKIHKGGVSILYKHIAWGLKGQNPDFVPSRHGCLAGIILNGPGDLVAPSHIIIDVLGYSKLSEEYGHMGGNKRKSYAAQFPYFGQNGGKRRAEPSGVRWG
ncbi:hypothetical protein BDZ45DRAFT_800466 [Acephala macrosclerotiorum]|nr:hypothetical protein BDZ45DRAFT_800466 [Acephala macrosclerotiorum]